MENEFPMMDLVFKKEASKRANDGIFSYVGKLPHVPLPTFEVSLALFEQWCTPLLTADETMQTREAIAQFAKPGGPASMLHNVLKDFDQQAGVHSWLDEFWPARYLGRRVPVSINANFIMLFKPQAFTQVEYAAFLTAGAVRYKQLLEQERLPAAMHRDKPLCSAQNKYLFSATRIPGKIRDTVRTPYSEAEPGPSQARHILVIHNHQLFQLDVIAKDGQVYGLGALEKAIQNILDSSQNNLAMQNSVGYLTTLPRTEWAQIRDQLLSASPDNLHNMESIEQALFCLCLDETLPDSLQHAADQLLHGDGGNRWFDKSISLIVSKNGSAGINVEHCGLDGTTIVDFVDFLFNDAVRDALHTNRNINMSTPDCSPLTFTLNSTIQDSIQSAGKSFIQLAENTATAYFSFDDFGASHIKSLKLSPDAFAQLGFQLAHFRTKGLIGATYESVSTRHFERGRTEAMRVVTPEIVAFVNSMQEPKSDHATQCRALRAAAEQHSLRLRQCQNGEAPEQHLWQLLLIAQQHGKALGTGDSFKLFESPGWLKMRADYLSTSSAPSDNIDVFGFGPTSEQCIGTAYLVRNDSIKAYLSTPSSVAHHMHAFAENLHTAFREMATVLQHEQV